MTRSSPSGSRPVTASSSCPRPAPCPQEAWTDATAVLEGLGLVVEHGEHAFDVHETIDYLAGTDEHRLAGVNDALRDPGIKAIIATHAHDDHVRVAPELRERVTAPILLHPADREVWELTHTDHLWDVDLEDGQTVKVAGASIKVLHTPGHAPGAVSLYVHDLGCVFTGDTLFEGGPGATGRSYSDADLIVRSIRSKLVDLPDDTVVHTGHGSDTTIGAEKANV